MSVLFVLLAVFAIVVVITSFISMFVYGKPMDDDIVLEWIEKVKKQGKFRANMYDSSIVSGETGNWKTDKYFSYPPLPTFFKYYIEDTGVIWRGSKGAKSLDQVREELNIGNSKQSQRQQLGL